MDLSACGPDILFAVFSHLDAADVWRARLVSKGWCAVSEQSFAQRCKLKRWCLPRRPRGEDAAAKFPHRRLYRNNAWGRCVDGPGAFRVSKDIGRQHIRQFSLCGVCLKNPACVERLKGWGLLIDFQSNVGKVLPGLKMKGGNTRTRVSGEATDQGMQGVV